MAFKVGDVVKLKSGGPLMTVTNPNCTVNGVAAVSCAWFDQAKPCANLFPPDSLEIVDQKGAPRSAG
jgi:uncharacterized protein YodC (DUF2158 family)